MTGRQIYRRVLTGALILVLGAISVLGFGTGPAVRFFWGGKSVKRAAAESADRLGGGRDGSRGRRLYGFLQFLRCDTAEDGEGTADFPGAGEGVRRKYRYLYGDKRCSDH